MNKITCFIIAMFLSLPAFGQDIITLRIGYDFKLNVPDIVYVEKPITWSVFLTNTMDRVARFHVATTADAFSFYGQLQAELSKNIVTNQLAPGESKLVTFSTAANWQPTNTTYNMIEFHACVIDLDTDDFDVNFTRSPVGSLSEKKDEMMVRLRNSIMQYHVP